MGLVGNPMRGDGDVSEDLEMMHACMAKGLYGDPLLVCGSLPGERKEGRRKRREEEEMSGIDLPKAVGIGCVAAYS